MTNKTLLKEKFQASGLKMTAICEKSGISRQSLHNKMAGKSEFTASEIAALSSVLSLTVEERDAIFFAQKVELKET